MLNVTINKKNLFKVGAYIGGLKSKRNPSMNKYIYSVKVNPDKNKVKKQTFLLNLNKTISNCKKLDSYLRSFILTPKDKILFFSTKFNTRDFVREQALSCDMPYIVDKWKGGLLTNFDTIKRKIRRLNQLNSIFDDSEKVSKLKKKERVSLERELKKLQSIYGGLSSLEERPKAIFFFGGKLSSSVNEANKSGVKVIALCKSDSDIANVDFVIPANNEKGKSISFFAAFVSSIVKKIFAND